MYKRITGRSIEVNFKFPWECFDLPKKFTISNNILDLKNKLVYVRRYKELLKTTPFENTLENTKMVLSRADGKPLINKYEDFDGDATVTIEEKFMSDDYGIDVYEEVVSFRSHRIAKLDTVYDRTILKRVEDSGEVSFYLVVKQGHTKLKGIAHSEYASLQESFKLVHLENYEQLKHSLYRLNEKIDMEKGYVEVGGLYCEGFPNQIFRGEWSVYKHLHQVIDEDSKKNIEEVFEWNVKAIKDMDGKYAYALNDKTNEQIDITSVMFVGHLLIEDSEYKCKVMSLHDYNIYQSLGLIEEVHPSELLTYAKSEIEKAKKKSDKKAKEVFSDEKCPPSMRFANSKKAISWSKDNDCTVPVSEDELSL